MPVIGTYQRNRVDSRIATNTGAAAGILNMTPQDREAMTQRLFNTTYQENVGVGTFEKIAGYAAGSAIDIADSLVANELIPGTDRGDVWNLVKDYAPMGRELENFYGRNQAGIELLSGVTGAVGTAYVGGALLLPRISNAMASSTMISSSKLWKSGARANAMIRSRMIEEQGKAAMAGEAFSTWKGAGLAYKGWEAGKLAGVAAFEEALIGATMNANKAIWSDEVSENLLFAGLGLGIGGAIGGMAARYEMRRIANSPELVKQRADAIDPQGIVFLRENQPSEDAIVQLTKDDNLRAKESANVTVNMLTARQAIPADATPEIVNRFDNMRNVAHKQAVDSLQKVARKGVKGIRSTGFSVEGSVGRHLEATLHDDPLAVFGLDSMGTFNKQSSMKMEAIEVKEAPTVDPILQRAREDLTKPKTKSEIDSLIRSIRETNGTGDAIRYRAEVERLQRTAREARERAKRAAKVETPLGAMLLGREDYIAALRATRVTRNIREADRLSKQQSLLLVNKSWLPAETPEAMALSAYKPGVKFTKTAKGAQEYRWTSETGRKMKVDESFDVKNYADLPINERMEVIEGMNHLFNQMRRAGQPYVIPGNPSWFQIDSAIDYMDRGGNVTRSAKSQTDEANMPILKEELELESLKKKAEAVKDAELGDFWVRQAFNLPLPSASERIYDAAGDSLRAILEAAQKGASLSELKALRQKMMDVHGFELKEADIPLRGELTNFNRDTDGKWQDMAVGFFDNNSSLQTLNEWGIAEQMAELKAQKVVELTSGNPRGGIVPGLTQSLYRTPEFHTAMQIRGLSDEQITGAGNWFRQASGEILTREFRFRDNPTLLSALRVREFINRWTDDHLSKMVKENLEDVIPRLNAAPAASSKALVNQFLSNTSGWDLKRAPVALEDGKWGFALEQTEKNARRLGRAVADDDLLVNPRTDAPIVLDNLGLEFVQRFNSMTNRILRDKNRIRKAMGLDEIKERPWYTPPRNTRGMHLGFTFDENNRLVPGGAIIARTRSEFDSLRTKKTAELSKGQIFRTLEEVQETADIWDRAAMDWIDPGVGPAPARAQTGSLSAEIINERAVQDALDWVKNQTEGLGTGIVRTLFDSQLGIARARAAVEHNIRGLKGSVVRTIWDEYEATLLGKSLGYTQRSISGKVSQPVEKTIDRTIEAAWPALSYMTPTQVNNWVSDLAHRMGVKKLKRASTFDELTRELGPHTPYKDAMDYAESVRKVSVPPEVRNISQSLNRLTSALYLRYFELPHAAMNMLGVITTMPSIIQAGKAPVSTFFDVRGKRVGVVDSFKILAEGMHDLTRASKHADWDFMVANGDTTQQVAEFNKQMSIVQDRSSFGRVFLGDESAEIMNARGAGSKAKKFAKQRGIDGMISLATDTTENWSRTWSHFVGLRLADMNGITGREARHSFAREIANAAIANYNPLNRPELYHSAFGSMFGLFMSWMQSYNQRLFRWMETGDYANVGRQAAVQASLFGVKSIPGYDHIEKVLLSAGVGETEDGREATLTDHIYARFGPGVGSAIAQGGVQELGIVLYTRGDMNYRDLSLDPSQLLAGVGVLDSAFKMVKESAQALFNEYSLEDSNRLSEALARNMPNRVMKGALTVLLNQGRDIDPRGQVISENRDFFESTIRMLGLRTQRQQAEIEAFYSNRQMEQREAARADVLRYETRALIRNNPEWESQLQSVFDKYVKVGMRPEHFRTWIRNQMRAAQSTRGMNDLVKAYKNPKNQLEVWRYNAYGAF